MKKLKTFSPLFILAGIVFFVLGGPCCSQDENNPPDPIEVTINESGSAAYAPQLDLPYPQIYAEGVNALADNPDVSDGSALTFNGQSTAVTRVYSSGNAQATPYSQTACAYYEFQLTDASATDGQGLWLETDVSDESVFLLINGTLVNPKQISQQAGNDYTTVETEFILDFDATTEQTIANENLPQNIHDMILESPWSDGMTATILATENFAAREWVLLPNTDYSLTVTRRTSGDPNPPDPEEQMGAPTYVIMYEFRLSAR